MERKLASIQKVISIEQIENADSIEKIKVLGWQLVSRKGQFKINDLCVYCEIDSIMPEKPEFEFLRDRMFRIKTIKLRGVISQGIAFPMDILPKGDYKIGDDVTELLGIKKYEPYIPIHTSGFVKGNFPSFIKKTDEIRIQTMPDFLSRHISDNFYISEKLDGTSVTYYFNNGVFGVCSRNLELKDGDIHCIYWNLAKAIGLEEKIQKYRKNIAIQGEIIGQGIAKNKYKINGQKLYCFNVFDIDNQKYLDFKDFNQVIKELELQTVPYCGYSQGTYLLNVDRLISSASGKSQINPSIEREGIVVRSLVEIPDIEAGRTSFKVVNPKFLLKFDE